MVNFFEGIDCIDKEKSEIDYDPDLWEEGDPLVVDETVFDDSVLRAIPEDQRLIFKMANVAWPHLYCHQRVVDYVRQQKLYRCHFCKSIRLLRGDGKSARLDWRIINQYKIIY